MFSFALSQLWFGINSLCFLSHSLFLSIALRLFLTSKLPFSSSCAPYATLLAKLPPRWAPETDLQWGPRHLDIHRGKTPGTSGPLTLWLCCSWNKLLIRLAGGELAPRLSLVSPKVFSPFCHRWSFRSLPVASGLLSWGHYISSDITDLIAQILFKLNWAGQCHY